MEYLKTAFQYTHIGYPSLFFYIIAIVGFLLCLIHPKKAFIFSIFCLTARNFHAAVFTRPTPLGPYLNLNDLLLWISLFSLIIETIKTKRRFWAPKILIAIFILVLIGDIQSIFNYGLIEETMRWIWFTAIFPIMFFIAVNMVNNEKGANNFYWALYLGSVIAAIQHMIFIYYRGQYHLMSDPSEIRTISYLMSGGLFLVIASLFDRSLKNFKRWKLIIFYMGLALVALSYILSFTRGTYVAMIILFIVLPLILKVKFNKIIYSTSILTLMALLIVNILFPKIELGDLIAKRFKSFIYPETFSIAYETRHLGAKTEFGLWLDSPIVIGHGATLPPDIVEISREDVYQTGALSHVGITTYLAHYGILGLLIYVIFLPILTIKIATRYYYVHSDDYGGKIALIAIACALADLIASLSSHHQLGATSHITGLIYGAIWGLYHAERKSTRFQKLKNENI